MPSTIAARSTSLLTGQQWFHHNSFLRHACCDYHNRAHFHTSRPCRARGNNHYEILGLTPSASQGDIKKQFYQLSKKYHPDRNPDNQEEASKKFIAISEAYKTLGEPATREKWDRENLQQSGPASSYASSYSSYSSPGGRKPSGLSRRRAQFRGPPPSFYRNGGWGDRAPRPDDSRSDFETFRRQQSEQQEQARANAANSEPGSWPFNQDYNDVPHFDREGHFRTTSKVEEQLRQGRTKRRRVWQQSKEDSDAESDYGGGALRSFLLVSSIVALGIGTPTFIWSFSSK